MGNMNARGEKWGSPVSVLTPKQKVFVKAIIGGMTLENAGAKAGYGYGKIGAQRAYESPNVQKALQYLHKKHEAAASMSRKKVMEGFLEAITIAKSKEEAGTMISGWREIGKLCGYYAPEVKQINLNVTARAVLTQMETMSDDELLRLVDKNQEAIEGEFTEAFDGDEIQEKLEEELGEEDAA